VGEAPKDDELSVRGVDRLAAGLRALVSAAPIGGGALAELIGYIIPNQRMERLVVFARLLDERLREVEEADLRHQLQDETFTDLMEEGAQQAARSTSQTRREYIANLIANSLTREEVSHVESKHLLRLLGELNDVEVIRLGSHNNLLGPTRDEYWEAHREVLEPVMAHMGSTQEEHDRSTMQKAYDGHLAQLGLLKPEFKVDRKTKSPEFDSSSGAQKIARHKITPLGRLLCREIGLPSDMPG
jgi:hypothetical protein